ncbi:expansin EXLX1 family cellulose-binding protein, partial [Sphaerisporangium corydalis]|uniref:expansin EXLX1 family cellulose-binding protein n=1 Tax=Sphaerisporangium corydalis TaxID=1441875 RepID=UPI0021D16668
MWHRLGWALSLAGALTLVALGAQAGRNGACADGATGRAGLIPGGALGDDCSLPDALAGDLVAAVSPEEYAGSAACGAYLDVTGPQGTARVQVVDECMSCAPGELDLSRSAFARIASAGQRVVRVGYLTVRNPEVGRTVAFRVKKGSSARWLAIQVLDHGNPLRRVEVRDGGRWRALSRDPDNYWVAAHGAGAGPWAVRVTDVFGQRLTATGIHLDPEDLQRTRHRLYAPTPTSRQPSTPRKPPIPRKPSTPRSLPSMPRSAPSLPRALPPTP